MSHHKGAEWGNIQTGKLESIQANLYIHQDIQTNVQYLRGASDLPLKTSDSEANKSSGSSSSSTEDEGSGAPQRPCSHCTQIRFCFPNWR